MDSKTLSSVQIKDADQGRVEAVFSTFGVIDHDGDVTDPSAFQHGSKVLISAYNHKTWDGALPVGKGTIEVTSSGARLKGQFFMDTQAGRDTFATVKALASDGLGEWSYGFEVEDSEHGEMEGKSVRVLKKLRVFEVSPVIKGAGVGTHTLAVKIAEEEEKNAQRGYGKDKDKKPKPKDEDDEDQDKDKESSDEEEDEDKPKKPRKPKSDETPSLKEEIDEAMDVVKSVIESVERVAALRAEMDKQLSKVASESLDGLRETLVKLDDVLSTQIETKEDATAAEKEFLRYVALNQLGENNV
jgi:phage head maturation protease